MTENALFDRLQSSAEEWRAAGWPCESEPLIGEILRWQFVGGDPEGALKFLRWPQFRALEVYWMLRLVYGTPHIVDLYKEIYKGDLPGFVDALGVPLAPEGLKWGNFTADSILAKIRDDDELVKKHGLDALREAAALPYPSYIFALAMGAGKTILIGSIIASEFGLSLRRDGRGDFMRNALVFADDKTILESLREIESMPYDRVLPPSMSRDFLANLKLAYTRDGEKDIRAVEGSAYNVVVTNTAKIRLRANTARQKKWSALEYETRKRQDEVEANLRLQKVASLPAIGVFSDEAHHLYGNAAGAKIKRVRETVNYIHDKAEGGIVAVVNTTGTPYYGGQRLKEVVAWYGLGKGIEDGVLKSLRNGVRRYDIAKRGDKTVVDAIVRDFFTDYGDMILPDGAKPKIAFYFKQRSHLEECRSIIERTMADIGRDAASILINTEDARKEDLDEFIRLNTPQSQKRVVLLVGKGVEGWNCPSLFACALVKEQTSDVFVLQAAARCLRQIPGNHVPARVYLDKDNAKKLQKELKRNFGASLSDLDVKPSLTETVTVRVRKAERLPKLEVTKMVRRATRKPDARKKAVRLFRPKQGESAPDAVMRVMTPGVAGDLVDSGERRALSEESSMTCLSVAARLAGNYHLSPMELLGELRKAYPGDKIPRTHWADLVRQTEAQCGGCEIVEERVTEALALIRARGPDGTLLFDENDDGCLVFRLRFTRDERKRRSDRGLFAVPEDIPDEGDLSYHYAPYNFDAVPERAVFAKILGELGIAPREVAHFLFTGGMTDPARTDFHFSYVDEGGRERLYFPDFVLVKKSGEFYILEVKSGGGLVDRNQEAKKKAVERLREVQPDKFKYHVVYVGDELDDGDLDPVRDWVRENRAARV